HKLSGLNGTSGNYIKNTLVSAVGSHKAGSMMEGNSLIDELKGIELLKWQPLHILEDALRDEHPQIIAVVLLCLDSDKAAQVLHSMPKSVSRVVVSRMTKLVPLSQSAMQILSDYLEELFTQSTKFKVLTTDAMNKAANIISRLDSDTEHEIISYLGKENKELSEKIQEKIFPFEKLGQLDGRSLQTLLAEVDSQQLLLCLKGADEALKKTFFKSMSSKSAELLIEDLESMGPVKIKEVIQAQKSIIEKAKQLAKDDKIIIPSVRKTVNQS
ncbi:MAG: flagellar motor switch protein FliG, partial [Legionellales bacterium]